MYKNGHCGITKEAKEGSNNCDVIMNGTPAFLHKFGLITKSNN